VRPPGHPATLVGPRLAGKLRGAPSTQAGSSVSMSQFSDAKTYLDLLHLFDFVGEALNNSRSKLPYPDVDARHVALRGMQEVVGGYAMSVSSMIHSRTQEQIIASFGYNNLPPDEARKIVENAWKNGLLVLFHFKIDSLLHNLLKANGTFDVNRKDFYSIAKDVVRLSGIPAGNDSLNILLTFAALRNSFHNNGMHRKPDRTLVLQDLNFTLKKDAAVDCASWGHVLAIVTESIYVLDEILASPVINGLPVPIIDDYALNPVDD
jgi:hypothetical protein